uniref:5-formyltetrahydrofolate cyclo-ligase n=1 Tax=Desulfovibrio sp. U5L TaxID=596152 RepID=I2Q1N9_9BACT
MQPYQISDTGKDALRREMRRRREALAPAFVAEASAAVAARVAALPRFAAAREVLAYLPVRNEVDAGLLAKMVLDSGRRLLLPRCRPNAPGFLDLGCVADLTDAVPGRFGILEPRPELCVLPEAFAPGLILVPGLAFDAHGLRLGQGGGYYDRLLALPMAAGALAVGLAYAFQMVPRLPAEPWDRPVDLVATEQQTHWFSK